MRGAEPGFYPIRKSDDGNQTLSFLTDKIPETLEKQMSGMKCSSEYWKYITYSLNY